MALLKDAKMVLHLASEMAWQMALLKGGRMDGLMDWLMEPQN